MQVTFKRDKKITIIGTKEYNFQSSSSLHLIVITARAKSQKQISPRATDDEDLIVKIDGKNFPSLNNQKRLFDSPAAYSGGTLHNLSKTVYFLTLLREGKHQITLITDKPSATATLESLEIFELGLDTEIDLKVNTQAEDGDRRPWLTFVFDQLPLESFTTTITYIQRRFDSDDVKIIFDGKTYTNLLKTIKYFFWRFAGFLLPGSQRTDTETFTVDAQEGLHYLEFFADRKPVFDIIQLALGTLNKEELTSYKNPPGRDYNRLNQAILNTVTYWNEFFSQQIYPPPILLEPNLVKAIIYRESRLGYYPNEKIVDVMQVWDPHNPARNALLGKTIANEFISSSKIGHLKYSYPDFAKIPKVETQEDSIFWGTRWLYHKAQYLLEDENGLLKPFVRRWRSWKEAIAAYNGNPRIVEEYVSEVFSVYEKGIDLEGNTLW